MVLSLPLCWFALVAGFRVPHRALDRQAVARALGDIGDWTTSERRLLPLIGIVSLLWITLPFLKDRLGPLALDDGAVAVGAGLFLLVGAIALVWAVVLALPDMMQGVGLGIDALQKATPIISGFLLG